MVSQGFFSFEDLSVIEPDQLAELGGLTLEQCDEIVARAEEESQREEAEAAVRKAQERANRDASAGPAPAPLRRRSKKRTAKRQPRRRRPMRPPRRQQWRNSCGGRGMRTARQKQRQRLQAWRRQRIPALLNSS